MKSEFNFPMWRRWILLICCLLYFETGFSTSFISNIHSFRNLFHISGGFLHRLSSSKTSNGNITDATIPEFMTTSSTLQILTNSANNSDGTTNNSLRIRFIKEVWRKHVDIFNETDIQDQLNEYISQNYSQQLTLQTLQLPGVLRTQILLQFLNPIVGKFLVKWLDTHFVLQLKGNGVFATKPEFFHNLSNNSKLHLLQPPIRMMLLKDTAKLTEEIRNSLIFSLSKSLGAYSITVNQQLIESIRKSISCDEYFHNISSNLNISSANEILTDETLFAALLDTLDDLSEKGSQPVVVGLDDDLTWIRENEGIISMLKAEEAKETSSIFFVALEPKLSLSEGTTLEQLTLSLDSEKAHSSAPSNPTSNKPTPVHGPSPIAQKPNFNPKFMSHRTFQIVQHKNGSTNMEVVPGNTSQAMFPPPAILERIRSEQMAKLRPDYADSKILPGVGQFVVSNQGSPGAPANMPLPPFPPNLSEEEIQEYLSAPENEEVIKSFVDKVVGVAKMHLPPGADASEIQVHMVQSSVPMFPSNNLSPSPVERVEEDLNEDKVEEDDESYLLNMFVRLSVPLPQDPSLRSLWRSLIEDEASARILSRNIANLLNVMESCGVSVDSQDALTGLNPLKNKVWAKSKLRSAISTAVKFQAAKLNPSSSHEYLDDRFVLSSSTLNIALTSIISNNIFSEFSYGRTMNKELLSTMITDKHEKSLLNNIVFPGDIGIDASFDNIGGLNEIKTLLRQSVTYPLKYPRLFQEGIASEAVKGLLLFGPPGTGKTMLAKAVSQECGASFLAVDASTIENKWLGESEKNAKAVFTLARRIAPCVIFIDEVDALLSAREGGGGEDGGSAHSTLTSVKTTLMQEWDGLRSSSKDRVIVIASTNRPFDLDEAVLRRLPRRILVDLPDEATREDILRVTLRNNRLGEDVDLKQLSRLLEGHSGSDIKEICREAVVRVANEKAEYLESGLIPSGSNDISYLSNEFSPLREVMMTDFHEAIKKLKASVADTSRELQRVLEWNQKYGEIKNTKTKTSKKLNLFI